MVTQDESYLKVKIEKGGYEWFLAMAIALTLCLSGLEITRGGVDNNQKFAASEDRGRRSHQKRVLCWPQIEADGSVSTGRPA